MRASKFVLATVLLVSSVASVAAEYTSQLKKADGSSVRIICNPNTCQVTIFDKSGNKVKVETSDGGNYGHAVNVEKYRALGYN